MLRLAHLCGLTTADAGLLGTSGLGNYRCNHQAFGFADFFAGLALGGRDGLAGGVDERLAGLGFKRFVIDGFPVVLIGFGGDVLEFLLVTALLRGCGRDVWMIVDERFGLRGALHLLPNGFE